MIHTHTQLSLCLYHTHTYTHVHTLTRTHKTFTNIVQKEELLEYLESSRKKSNIY
jgi:hypothetical protein